MAKGQMRSNKEAKKPKKEKPKVLATAGINGNGPGNAATRIAASQEKTKAGK